jgi:hypothetical protein
MSALAAGVTGILVLEFRPDRPWKGWPKRNDVTLLNATKTATSTLLRTSCQPPQAVLSIGISRNQRYRSEGHGRNAMRKSAQ